MHKVFVYGSLRQGYGNHRLLEDSRFLGIATTAPEYTMLHLGGFPGLVKAGETRIVGELYEVDDTTLRQLDRLEGHPNFYERTPIEVEYDEGLIDAEVYLIPQHWLDDNRNEVVESGDWTNVRRRREVV